MDISLVSQDALGKTDVCQDGQEKSVHAVVKRCPYECRFRRTDGTFENVAISARLVFDDYPDTDVVCQRHTPLTYQGKVCEDSREYSLTTTFGTLSSQHEDLHFRVRLEAQCKLTGASSVVYTHPVWVVSKPKVYAKAMERKGVPQRDVPKVARSRPTRQNSLLTLKCDLSSTKVSVGHKRKASELEGDTVAGIGSRLDRIESAIHQLAKRQCVAPRADGGYARFSAALQECMEAYNSLSPMESGDHESELQRIGEQAAVKGGYQSALCVALLLFGSVRGGDAGAKDMPVPEVSTDTLLRCSSLRADSASLDAFSSFLSGSFRYDDACEEKPSFLPTVPPF